ncbi:MAG: glutamate formimidoyltransferase [Vicinamibacterales bacterium]
MIESIPNVSEGRDLALVAELARAVRGTSGAILLDASADPSHHRSVYTIVGAADALQRAILDLTAIAVARIDLRAHRGVHPRIGAVDVVPFVPLDGATMPECVHLARSVGAAIAAHFGVPVYLYEEAAVDPMRRRLEHIRQGGFEGLAERMHRPEWTPDFGPAAPHPTAGATVVGARWPLVAFNVNLATGDLAAAKAIARSVRESSGGLPCVKALGLLLPHRGLAQVSMNLTNYRRTPVRTAFEAVRQAADALGVTVLESELIGLIPAAALAGTTPADLLLEGFSPGQVLETRLAEAIAGR